MSETLPERSGVRFDLQPGLHELSAVADWFKDPDYITDDPAEALETATKYADIFRQQLVEQGVIGQPVSVDTDIVRHVQHQYDNEGMPLRQADVWSTSQTNSNQHITINGMVWDIVPRAVSATNPSEDGSGATGYRPAIFVLVTDGTRRYGPTDRPHASFAISPADKLRFWNDAAITNRDTAFNRILTFGNGNLAMIAQDLIEATPDWDNDPQAYAAAALAFTDAIQDLPPHNKQAAREAVAGLLTAVMRLNPDVPYFIDFSKIVKVYPSENQHDDYRWAAKKPGKTLVRVARIECGPTFTDRVVHVTSPDTPYLVIEQVQRPDIETITAPNAHPKSKKVMIPLHSLRAIEPQI